MCVQTTLRGGIGERANAAGAADVFDYVLLDAKTAGDLGRAPLTPPTVKPPAFTRMLSFSLSRLSPSMSDGID